MADPCRHTVPVSIHLFLLKTATRCKTIHKLHDVLALWVDSFGNHSSLWSLISLNLHPPSADSNYLFLGDFSCWMLFEIVPFDGANLVIHRRHSTHLCLDVIYRDYSDLKKFNKSGYALMEVPFPSPFITYSTVVFLADAHRTRPGYGCRMDIC